MQKVIKPILLNLPMPIITPRLLIQPPQAGDGAVLNTAIIESFDILHQFMDWAREKPTIEESEERVRMAAANWLLKKNEEPWLQLSIFDKTTHDLLVQPVFITLIGMSLVLKQAIGFEVLVQGRDL